ncbi:hydroxyacid dehydrogenase [Aestuariimicrobium ganziense]|uniref:hydroxyacid dehydrogenase n=1 Tax=Aestuariimicrobium ganziense TaxID=2773677 RepID=UPI00194093B0|nr:hydroxyacid dehydrogenase [Aestuariimicrobium ganziense]
MNTLSRVRFAMTPRFTDQLFRPEMLAPLDLARVEPEQVVRSWDEVGDDELAEVEVVVTGWGAPRIDADVLRRMPRLRGICHSAGTVRAIIYPVVYERGVRVTTAAAANAVPVGEFALAMIILACKQVFRANVEYRPGHSVDHHRDFSTSGTYRRRVGLVGASTIGRLVIEHLHRSTDLEVWVADPYLTAEEAGRLGVTKVELDELLAGCDVVSLHAPLLDSTRGMITARELALLPDGATFINTARGGLVDHAALESELVSGRIWAVIDTTDPFEPLPDDSVLYGLPNVFLTPHIAGSQGNELARMGDLALRNAAALLSSDDPTTVVLEGEVTRELYDRLA